MPDAASRTITFQSGGSAIRLEAFVPASSSPLPALLLLHGASGLGGGNGYIPQLASALAEQGFATLVLRYFDATATGYADDAMIWRHFDRWLQVVHDAVGAVAELPELDHQRIGLVGYSLGGYLAVAHAARDSRIRAVVEFAGGMDQSFAKDVRRLPPTMVVHGEKDRRVLFARAEELVALLKRVGAPFESRFYPEEGHYFSPATGLDALVHGIEFLRRHMKIGTPTSLASQPES